MTYTGSLAQAGRGSVLGIGETLSVTGDTASSTTISSVSSTAGITVGMAISGTGIPAGATVTAIGSATLTISAAATATASGVDLTVGPTPVGEVTNDPINRGEWDQEDVTNFESGADSEVINTIRKTGTVDIELNRVSSDAGQVAVEAAYQSGDRVAFTLLLPIAAGKSAGDAYTFEGLVKGSSFTVDVTKAIKGKITLVITGGMTLAVGS